MPRISRSLLALFAMAIVATVSMASSLSAAPLVEEDGNCGSYCLPCEGAPDPDWKYGGGSSSTKPYQAYCTTGWCRTCGATLKKSTTETESGVALLRELRVTTDESKLAAFAQRVRIHPSKNMVVLLGGCDGNAVEGVVFLSPQRIRLLAASGAKSLDDHMASIRRSRALASK